MTELDLSKLTRLQDVVFRYGEPNVEWVTKVLNTIGSKHLQHMSLELYCYLTIGDTIWERVRQEWLDLDCLLVRFWDSNSLRSRVTYRPVKGMSDHMAGLLPELTRRGIVELVQGKC